MQLQVEHANLIQPHQAGIARSSRHTLLVIEEISVRCLYLEELDLMDLNRPCFLRNVAGQTCLKSEHCKLEGAGVEAAGPAIFSAALGGQILQENLRTHKHTLRIKNTYDVKASCHMPT